MLLRGYYYRSPQEVAPLRGLTDNMAHHSSTKGESVQGTSSMQRQSQCEGESVQGTSLMQRQASSQ